MAGTMGRTASSEFPITPQLLRHFAAATVIITACLAMFADQGNREAIANTVKEREAMNRAMIAEHERVGARTVVVSEMQVPPGAPSGNAPLGETRHGDTIYGGTGYDPGGYIAATPAAGIGATGSGPTPKGTDAPRKKNGTELDPEEPSQQDIEELRAASMARSGSWGGDSAE